MQQLWVKAQTWCPLIGSKRDPKVITASSRIVVVCSPGDFPGCFFSNGGQCVQWLLYFCFPPSAPAPNSPLEVWMAASRDGSSRKTKPIKLVCSETVFYNRLSVAGLLSLNTWTDNYWRRCRWGSSAFRAHAGAPVKSCEFDGQHFFKLKYYFTCSVIQMWQHVGQPLLALRRIRGRNVKDEREPRAPLGDLNGIFQIAIMSENKEI